jgi:DNA-binding NtrC family response regulator
MSDFHEFDVPAVMVVDDDRQIRRLLRLALEREHFEIVECADGYEALEVMAAREGHVAAVISDIHMPRMDGVSLQSASTLRYPGVPFVLMSASEPDAASSGLRAAAFIAKPFELQALLRIVRSLVPHASPAKPIPLSNNC